MDPSARPVSRSKAPQRPEGVMISSVLERLDVGEDSLRRAIYQHVASFWPNSLIAEEKWEMGPIEERVPGFRVLRLNSRERGKPVIYVTLGCFVSELRAHVKHEFFLISPREDAQHVETLTMLADFHADKSYSTDLGSILNIGEAWIERSGCNHLLISVPYPYGPKLEWLKTDDGCVRFLWALPITDREAAFAELHGVEALEQKFDVAKLNYLDVSRPSVV